MAEWYSGLGHLAKRIRRWIRRSFCLGGLLPFALLAQQGEASDSTRAAGIAPPGFQQPTREDPAAPNDVGKDPPIDDAEGTTFAVAPIPSYNPQFGAGLAVVGMAFRRLDQHEGTPTSTGALIAYASENGTWGVALGGIAHFAGDAWRVAGAAGYFKLFYDFYGFGTDAGDQGESIELRQPAAFAFGQVLRRVVPNFYAGGRILYLHSSFTVNDNTLPPELASFGGLNVTVNSLAFAPVMQFDSRDNQYFPTRGLNGSLAVTMAFAGVGSDSTYQRVYGYLGFYHGWAGGRQILALGIDGCSATGEISFSNYCTIGELKGIRGYQPGRYQDRFKAASRRSIGARSGEVRGSGVRRPCGRVALAG